MRETTERPVTADIGSNVITGSDPVKILAAAEQILNGNARQGKIPPLWDGHTAERIVDILNRQMSQ